MRLIRRIDIEAYRNSVMDPLSRVLFVYKSRDQLGSGKNATLCLGGGVDGIFITSNQREKQTIFESKQTIAHVIFVKIAEFYKTFILLNEIL